MNGPTSVQVRVSCQKPASLRKRSRCTEPSGPTGARKGRGPVRPTPRQQQDVGEAARRHGPTPTGFRPVDPARECAGEAASELQEEALIRVLWLARSQ